MPQTYDVRIDFATENIPFDHLEKILDSMSKPDSKGLALTLNWELNKKAEVIHSEIIQSTNPCVGMIPKVNRSRN